ncbi:isoflavone-7-O-methyltransferase 9-like [Capsicum annuum]|uniref:isoflavone-7-O-methyltransferase 9-like n=1 Tax=Capsicum annuum TaxID=4072 RepID=UPI001FB19FAC|nr:isoflavone-7-O-methyltransferase 9-like [Capsicum annuum]
MAIENKSNACTTRIKLILQQTPSSLSLSGSKTILSPGVKNSLQHVMYNWSDEDCVSDKNEGRKGKVLIIDMVLNRDEDEANMTEVKLIFDILMMVYVTGRQRTEKEWEKLFLELRLAS